MIEPDGLGLHGEIACKATTIPVCGLFPLFEGSKPPLQPALYNASIALDVPEFMGVSNNILLDSHHIQGYEGNDAAAPIVKTSKPKNRKYVTSKETIAIDGTDYKINVTAKSGVFSKILKEAHAELQWMVEKHAKVHVHFFDLRFSERYSTDIPLDSRWIRKLFRNVKRKINRHYGTKHIGHLWVREQERAKAQHYHCMVIVDGKKTRFPHYLKKVIEKEWFSISGGSLAWPEKCYYNLNSKKEQFQEIKADIIYRISYRAKQRGKGYRPPQAKDYSTSRLAKL